MALKIAVKTGFDGWFGKGMEGQTVVVNPVSYHPNITIEFGVEDKYPTKVDGVVVPRERPGLIGEVVVFDAKGNGAWLGRQMITQPTVVKNLRGTVGSGEVTVGTLAKQTPKGAGNDYWVIKDPTDDEITLAVAWDEKNPNLFSGEQGPPKAPAAAVVPAQAGAPAIEVDDNPFGDD